MRPAYDYLRGRGFHAVTIAEHHWRIEPLGDSATVYGLPPSARDALVWVIPYREFERKRLIDPEDIARYPGGRYRQPAGQGLTLYDPLGWLRLGRVVSSAMLIEGEANAGSIRQAVPGLPAIGLPGKALSVDMASELGRVATVYIWLDRHDKGFAEAQANAAARLYGAGVQHVLEVGDTGGLDANDLLVQLGDIAMKERMMALLESAVRLDRPAPKPPPKPTSNWWLRQRATSAGTDIDRWRDELREIPATVYLPELFDGVEFRRGKSLCCFHDERTPSLGIHSSRTDGRQRYRCWGCGANGDAWDAAAAAWGLDARSDFVEITRRLAETFLGVTV